MFRFDDYRAIAGPVGADVLKTVGVVPAIGPGGREIRKTAGSQSQFPDEIAYP